MKILYFYSEQYRNDIKKYIIFSASVTLHGHNGPIYGLSFSPDRSLLLSCSEDGTIRLWSLQTWTCLVNYKVWYIIHLYITQRYINRLFCNDHFQYNSMTYFSRHIYFLCGKLNFLTMVIIL